ncbi:MAG TPA: NAD(P)H-dependent oxidoreductase [Fermentimonas sp.]|nr:NAD(P)H-dependent oxidoreductase [Fermentimonas sp.]
MSKKKIAILVGSLREGSFNRKLALDAIKMQPDTLDMEIVEIGQLAHYNEDLDNANPPAEWVEFRKKIKEADGYLFFTPEYNRSISGVLKNAIDVGSRPYGQNNWGGKPGAVVSSSISPLGGEAANHVLRQPMVFVDVYMMQQPEAYIGNTMTLFNDKGEISNPDTRQFLNDWLKAFESWVYKF